MAADLRLGGALRALALALDEIPALSMIIGGVAVIAAGVPLVLYLHQIDLARVRRLIAEIASALDDPQRVSAFEVIVARVRA